MTNDPPTRRRIQAASTLLVAAATVYSVMVGLFGSARVTVGSDEPPTESFYLNPAGLIVVLASIVSLVAVRRRDTRTLWVAAGGVLVVSALFLFSIGAALLPVGAVLAVAAALLTLSSTGSRTNVGDDQPMG